MPAINAIVRVTIFKGFFNYLNKFQILRVSKKQSVWASGCLSKYVRI